MGMGEPFANYDRTWGAVERLHGDLGISARHLTLSTVGIIPGIRRLAAEQLPVNLAVSLHAANDTLRDELVPINRRYPIAALAEACREYLAAKNRRLSFEWALIAGVNDRASDADELAAIARPLRAHVNLIPLNPTPGYRTVGAPPRRRACLPRPARVARGQRHGASQPRHRHRRGVRPAPRDACTPADTSTGTAHCENDAMNETRWIDRSQPERLQQATMMLYVTAAFDVVSALFSASALTLVFLILAAVKVAGGFGIANEKKIGYIGGHRWRRRLAPPRPRAAAGEPRARAHRCRHRRVGRVACCCTNPAAATSASGSSERRHPTGRSPSRRATTRSAPCGRCSTRSRRATTS